MKTCKKLQWKSRSRKAELIFEEDQMAIQVEKAKKILRNIRSDSGKGEIAQINWDSAREKESLVSQANIG